MPYQATVFNVLIASPGDVEDERKLIREVCQEWNAVHSKSREIVLNPVGWETHSHPDMSDRPQGVINKQLVDDADMVVAVFWTKIGTPTGEAPGGSVEELTRHLSAGKPAMVYFSDQSVKPSKAATQQYRDLLEFRDNWAKPRGLLQTYETLEEFRKLFARHIAQKVNDDPYLKKHIKFQAGMMPVHVLKSSEDNLSEEATRLLLEAAKDSAGAIAVRQNPRTGNILFTNGKQFIVDRTPRSSALWMAALDQLVKQGLVQKGSGPYYQITDVGYKRADKLNTQ